MLHQVVETKLTQMEQLGQNIIKCWVERTVLFLPTSKYYYSFIIAWDSLFFQFNVLFGFQLWIGMDWI